MQDLMVTDRAGHDDANATVGQQWPMDLPPDFAGRIRKIRGDILACGVPAKTTHHLMAKLIAARADMVRSAR